MRKGLFLALIGLYCLGIALLFTGCATGSSILTGQQRPATNFEEVKFYLEPPAKYDVIGIVEAASDAGLTSQQSQNYAIHELKKQAAKIGANGVLIRQTGEKTSTTVGGYGTGMIWAVPVTSKTIIGTAIYVIEE